MMTTRLSRTDKEALYIEKATALRLRCEHSLSGDWDFVHRFSDEELQTGIDDTIGQIRLERCWSNLVKISRAGIGVSVLLAIAWVVHFFIRQIV